MMTLAYMQAGTSPANDASISSGDLLTVLLTTETLLFAALGVGVTIQTVVQNEYLPAFIKKGHLALWVFLLIAAVAVGAAAAWYDLFGKDWPQDTFRPLAENVALAIGIVAQPILAFAVWRGVKDP